MYDTGMQRYEEEVNNLTEAIKKQEKIDAISVDLAANIFELASKAKSLWLNVFDDNQKRRFLKLATLNSFLKNNSLDITFKNGFEVLEKRPITAEINLEPQSGHTLNYLRL